MAFNAAIGTLSIKISADTSDVRRGIKDTNKQLSKSDKALERNKRQWKTWGSTAKVALVGISILAARSILKMADSFTSVQNQIRQTTKSTEELAKRTQDLIGISKRSRIELSTIADIYTQTTLNTEELGLSTEKLLRITETIAKSFAISGKSIAQSSGAIRQLNQAFSRGQLRGEEFNSIIEGAPELARAMRRSLKLTQGQLIKFAATGGITSKVLIKTLTEAADVIDKKMSATTKTLAQSFEEAKTNASAFLGTSDLVSGSMGNMGKVIIALSENLDILGNVALAALIVGFGKLSASMLITTAKSIKLTQSNIVLIRSEQAAAVEALKLARAEQAAAVGMFNAASGATKASIANTQLTAVNTALAAATNRASVANAAFATSATLAGRAVTFLKGGMALLGGPVGIAIIAAASIATFAFSESEAEKETKQFTKSIDDQIDALRNLNETQKELTDKGLEETRAKIKTLEERLVEYRKQAITASQSTRDFGSGFSTLNAKISETSEEIDRLTKKESDLKRLAKAISLEAEKGAEEEKNKKTKEFEKLEQDVANAQFKRRLENVQSKKKENEDLQKLRQEEFQGELDAQSNKLAAEKEFDERKETLRVETAAKEKERRVLSAQDELADFLKQTASRVELEKILHQDEVLRAQAVFAELKTSKMDQDGIIEALEGQHKQRLNDIEFAENEAKRQIFERNAGSLLSSLAVVGKKSVKIQKAVALAQAAIAISTGIARAQELGFPLNIVEMARVAAVGVSAIRSIKGASVGSASTPSGRAGGGGGGGSTQPAAAPPPPQQINRTIDVKFSGQGNMSQSQVRALIEQFNEALGDGAQLNVVGG